MLVKPGSQVSLKEIDPADTGSYKSAKDAEQALQKLEDELTRLQYLLYADTRWALLVVLQGTDTSGKDGTIRQVMSSVSPLGVQVSAFKAPNEEELAHDFLWRIHKAVPKRVYIGISTRPH